MQACQALACQLYPHIPECGYTISQPVCSSQVEYRTLSCPIHQSGAINETRTYQCSSQSWTPWTTTSNNCTQDPPTCTQNTETRTLTCPTGYTGYITESRTSVCSDPYGSPTWTSWSTTSDTCTMTMTNVNNVTSPVSPISPLNPNSALNQQVTNAPVAPIEPVTVQDMTVQTTTITETPTTSVATTSSQPTTSATSSVGSVTTTTSGTDKKETVSAPNVPKGKELVPGFGIVMSMQLLNSGYNLQQQQMTEYINLIQEQEYGKQQDFLIDLISANDTGDNFNRIADYRWKRLLSNNPLQSNGFGN